MSKVIAFYNNKLYTVTNDLYTITGGPYGF